MFKVKKKKENERKIHMVDEKKSPFLVTESFRKITTNISFAIPKKDGGKGKVFCITSSVAGEGKTTVAVNLALTFARSGAKTVLVDCDLRRPSVRRYFPKCRKRGIVTYLTGETSLDDIIEEDVEANMAVLIARQSPPSPMPLINSNWFDKMLDELATKYEVVIIDTPPLGLVPDSSIIGKKTDGVIIVTRQLYSNHKNIKKIVNQLNFAQCNILGFILNGYSISQGSTYGGKYGRYGKYGYRYGYSENKNNSKSGT